MSLPSSPFLLDKFDLVISLYYTFFVEGDSVPKINLPWSKNNGQVEYLSRLTCDKALYLILLSIEVVVAELQNLD